MTAWFRSLAPAPFHTLDDLDVHAKSRLSEWNADQNNMETAFKRMKQDMSVRISMRLPEKLCIDTPVTPFEAALFLYCKNLHTHMTSTKELVCKLLTPSNPKLVECLQRLVHLLEHPHDTTSSHLPDGVQSFESALYNLHPSWSDRDASFICHLDDPMQQGMLVQRVQKAGLCSMHAPAVLQHYLVARSGVKPAFNGMADISTVVRKCFTTEQLTNHIVNGESRASHIFLKSLLLPNSEVTHISPAFVTRAFLLTYGPVLVSRFQVFDDFFQSKSCVFDTWGGTGSIRGWHAMVLIGVRIDEAGNKFFLLQNWWAQRQFIEVSLSYLEQSNATLYYVKTPQTSFPPNVKVNWVISFAETESCVDTGEKLNDEW
jgi:hypothetical protein